MVNQKLYLHLCHILYNKLFSKNIEMQRSTKKIKLQSKYRALAWGKQKIVPELRVNGMWLEQHGFKAGEQVEITIEPNQLTIKPQR